MAAGAWHACGRLQQHHIHDTTAAATFRPLAPCSVDRLVYPLSPTRTKWFVTKAVRPLFPLLHARALPSSSLNLTLQESPAGPTATCLCFVTPDGQRTMRTCLGASAHLTSADQLPAGWCEGAVLLHCEGYCLYRPQLAAEAMRRAKQAGALVSLDLASFECVQNCSR